MKNAKNPKSVLYHGSPKNIKGKYLLPRASYVLKGDSAVFATNRLEIAALFAANITDADIYIGVHHGKFYIKEQYPGAFELLQKPAWIYIVDQDDFKDDPRLGLRGLEFISEKKVPIMKKIHINSIWDEIKRRSSKINVISHKQVMRAIKPLLKK